MGPNIGSTAIFTKCKNQTRSDQFKTMEAKNCFRKDLTLSTKLSSVREDHDDEGQDSWSDLKRNPLPSFNISPLVTGTYTGRKTKQNTEFRNEDRLWMKEEEGGDPAKGKSDVHAVSRRSRRRKKKHQDLKNLHTNVVGKIFYLKEA